MASLIDKSALVAEIEKLKSEALQKKSQCKRSGLEKIMHQIGAYNKVLSFIDTLEVKKVDLEKDIDAFLAREWDGIEEDKHFYVMIKNDLSDIAKHFFELGLKAQNDNIRHSMNEPPNYPCDILFVTDVNNMFLYRYMENGRPVDRETPYFRDIENGKCWYYCNDILNIH